MKYLGYFLIALAAAVIAAPISSRPRIRHGAINSTGHQFLSRGNGIRTMTLDLVTGLADQLRVGHSPIQALAEASVLYPELHLEITSQTRLEDALAELRDGAVKGADALLKVALFIELSDQRGTSLIPALDAIAESIENELEIEEELLSEIAGARATAILMSLLPVLILMALHPFHFLFGTLIGRIALTGAVTLNALGRFWLNRITRSALVVVS
ncbi:MAG TPA: hypothetical protein VMV52_10510 [Candidatus Nanopelagicaceae bacterium]|nr:hypothetical protein [Candidatus Nanopelagicaceae bacterium]